MKILKTTPDFLPLEKFDFTDDQLVEMYNQVFTNTHSRGFMIGEMKGLLFDKDYWFMEPKKLDWEENLKNKLKEFGYEK